MHIGNLLRICQETLYPSKNDVDFVVYFFKKSMSEPKTEEEIAENAEEEYYPYYSVENKSDISRLFSTGYISKVKLAKIVSNFNKTKLIAELRKFNDQKNMHFINALIDNGIDCDISNVAKTFTNYFVAALNNPKRKVTIDKKTKNKDSNNKRKLKNVKNNKVKTTSKNNKKLKEYFDDLIARFGFVKITGINNRIPFEDIYVQNYYSYYPTFFRSTIHRKDNEIDLNKKLERNILIDFATGKNKNILLLGSAGVGKSTFLLNILLKLIKSFNQTKILPLYVALKNYNAGSLNEYIDNLMLPNCSNKLIILDGLDELDSNIAEKLLNDINTTSYLKNSPRIIISSRPMEGLDYLSNFAKLYLLPFMPMQVNRYINNLSKFTKSLDEKMYDIQKFVRSHHRTMQYPLFLNMTFSSILTSGKIPTNDTDMYGDFFEVLLYRHDIENKNLKRKHHTKLRHDDFKFLISNFAYYCFMQGKYSVDRDMIIDFLNKIPTTSKISNVDSLDFIYDFNTSIPVLTSSISNNIENYSFIHKSFLEYFIAYYISTNYTEIRHSLFDIFNSPTRFSYTLILDFLFDLLKKQSKESYIDIDIIKPFLTKLFSKEMSIEKYALKYYPSFRAQASNDSLLIPFVPQSYILEFIKKYLGILPLFYKPEDLAKIKKSKDFIDSTINFKPNSSFSAASLETLIRKIPTLNFHISIRKLIEEKNKYPEIYDYFLGKKSPLAIELFELKTQLRFLNLKYKKDQIT